MLTELSLDTLLDQEFEGCHRAERVQNSKMPYVRCLIGRNEKKFDYINHVVMLTVPSLDTLLDQEFEIRHRAKGVQNSEVPYVRCLVGGNEKKFDYINRVVKRFHFWSTRDVDTLFSSRCYASPR